jgi:endonuclease/exonuclease/phosphatase family metal-dependent hydrolase
MLHVLIVIVVAMLLLSAFGCAAPPTSGTSRDEPRPLRVMCFNIRCSTATGDGENHWSKRREIFFRTIECFNPDLLGLQEVISDQADELRSHFAGTHTFVGVGRDDGQRKGEFAAILFRTDRFELIDQGHIWLSKSPETPGSVSWDSSLTRMASWVKLRDRQRSSRDPFIFMNTHFDHIGEVARLESAKLLRKRLGELSDNGKLAVIFTGDLNCTEDDAPVPVLLNAGLTDAYRATHRQRDDHEQTFHAFDGNTKGSRIDFIMLSSQFRATQCDIDRLNEAGRYPSDHFAVECVVQRSEKPGSEK